MISTRQFRMLYSMYTACLTDSVAGFPIDELADEHEVSSRTIRSDMDAIAEYLADNNSGMSCSVDKNTISLELDNTELAAAFMDQTVAEMQKTFYYVDDYARAKHIIETVLLSKTRVKLEKLANDLFISQSRLSQDLKTVRKLLSHYNLELDQVKGAGITIVGDPLNKRTCFMKESTIALADDINYINNQKYKHMLDMASDIVTSVLLKHEFSVSDVTLQNIVAHVAATVEMLLRKVTIDDGYQVEIPVHLHEHEIAEEILERCAKRFGLVYTETEVEVLAINIQGKREYDADSFVSEEMDEIVKHGLKHVTAVYGIDLMENLDLRVALALHLTPLRARLKHDAQVTNALTLFIKQNYSLPFEIATTFITAALPELSEYISDDELSYLACHFSTIMLPAKQDNKDKRVVIVTRDKKSSILFMRQQLKSHFPQIVQIDVSHVYEQRSLELDLYDCIIVTEKDLTHIHPDCIYVSHLSFDEDEERRIAFALAGFRVERDIISKLDPKLFCIGHAISKHNAIDQLFSMAAAENLAGEDVFELVRLHEDSTNSYFGNHLAIPHAEVLHESCKRSFIAVFISDTAFLWNDYDVDMAMLLILHPSDVARYQMWNYLSLVVSKAEYVDALRACRDFDTFISTLRTIFKLAL